MKPLLLLVLSVILTLACTVPATLSPSEPSQTCHANGALPDPTCTPGAANPDVTQATIAATICNPAWHTSSIRPPVSYTEPLKSRQIAEYGYADTRLADYELDHLIPLEAGGDPRDPRNLWPEPLGGPDNARVKDKTETALHDAICSGRIGLDAGRQAIATDWVALCRQLQADPSC